MTIGAQFATLAYVEAMRRKLERMITGMGVGQHGPDVDSVENFIDLADVPQSYASATGNIPTVNAAEDGLEWNPYVLASATTPTLTIRNATDSAVDPVLQFALGATPVVHYTMGVDDDNAERLTLNTGATLTNDHTTGQVISIDADASFVEVLPKVRLGYGTNTWCALYGCDDNTADAQSELSVTWSHNAPKDYYYGIIDLYAYTSDTSLNPALNNAVIDIDSNGYARISAGYYGAGDTAYIQLITGDGNVGGDTDSRIYSYAGKWVHDGIVTLRSDDYATALRFEETGTGTDYVGLIAPAAITTSFTLTLPSATAGAKKHMLTGATDILGWGQNVDTDAGPTFDHLHITNDTDVGGVYKVDNVQVIKEQQAHVADPTGGDVVDTEARATISTLLTKLEAHGLLASS